MADLVESGRARIESARTSRLFCGIDQREKEGFEKEEACGELFKNATASPLKGQGAVNRLDEFTRVDILATIEVAVRSMEYLQPQFDIAGGIKILN
ncbi:hypothetical protein E4U46_007175, partial [Claviceps purpurea]